ncbi:baseplate multidomain protein megatron [Roseobacter sp. A03A-229]
MPSISKKHGLRLGASWIGSASRDLQDEFLNDLDEGELLALPFLFEFWAMEHQLPPEGDWRSWVIMGGRGAGKTRAGAEWVRAQVEGARPMDEGRAHRVALVGETVDQVREVMIFGDSGILACSPPDRRPTWEAGRKRLVWPNGAIATVHSAYDPEGLRGPQFDAAWVDEIGCASVDKGTNQPNKFLDMKSSESSLPNFSNGARDDFIQAQYLRALASFWGDTEKNPTSAVYGGPMVDMSRAFVWAWDARPYPYFPNNAALWSDAENYARGHWINGRTSARSLASVVAEICRKAGVTNYDTSRLYGTVRGYLVNDVNDARASLQPLMLRYSFDAVERDGELVFRMRNGQNPLQLNREVLALSEELDGVIEQSRSSQADMAGRVRLRFVQADAEFDVLAEEAVLADERTHSVSTSEIPIALTRGEGRQTAERWLTEARIARDAIRFALPPSCLTMGAGDVIELQGDQAEGRALYRIDRVEQGALQIVEAVRIEPDVYTSAEMIDDVPSPRPFVPPVPVTPLFLDLPLITGDEIPHAPHVAVTAQPWQGSVAVYRSPSDSDFRLVSQLSARSIVGTTQSPMVAAASGRLDRGAPLEVKLISGTLSSVELQSMLSGANLAAIGDGSPDNWEVFQFANATLVDKQTYHLSARLRGQLGSDGLMPDVWPEGSWFVLLNGFPEQIDLGRNLRRVSQTYRIGPARRPVDDLSYVQEVQAFNGNGERPYAPVHLRTTRATNGDVTVTWVRRTRQDGDGWDVPDVPLGEESEAYSVRVLQGETVVREVTVAAPQWQYTVADQLADGATGEVELEVSQISAAYGPGLPGRISMAL